MGLPYPDREGLKRPGRKAVAAACQDVFALSLPVLQYFSELFVIDLEQYEAASTYASEREVNFPIFTCTPKPSLAPVLWHDFR